MTKYVETGPLKQFIIIIIIIIIIYYLLLFIIIYYYILLFIIIYVVLQKFFQHANCIFFVIFKEMGESYQILSQKPSFVCPVLTTL